MDAQLYMGLDTHFFDGVGYPFLQTMVVLCRFTLEALHTWIWLSPEGPRLYTPLSFSLNSGDLTPTTRFGLTAGPHQNLDNRLAPFHLPSRTGYLGAPTPITVMDCFDKKHAFD